MKVCVAYATRHGSTRDIAERIGATLGAAGFDVQVGRAEQLRSVEAFDAFVVGSAVYIGSWLQEATTFADRHRDVLAARPVWLFSSGPLGTSMTDPQGRSVLEDPKAVVRLVETLRPRGTRVFFGAFDPSQRPAALSERLVRAMPASKDLLPEGDFRDWAAIDAWAAEIAAALRASPVAATSG